MQDENNDPQNETVATEAPAVDSSNRIKELEEQAAQLKDQLLRALAETENVRRRANNEREDTSKYAVTKFARDMLSVTDNLRRALDAVPADAREKDAFLQNLFTGIDATERQLLSSFEKAGIRKLEAMGAAFDPNFHHVVMEVENTGKPAGTIVQVLQDGYVIHDRLLREAMVAIAKGDASKLAPTINIEA